jgi:D-glycero-beta-D-manno-heptose 1-phosphate adenylyltransferase
MHLDLESKIVSISAMKIIRDEWEKDELRVVFTNGVFDLIHPGHVHYLNAASNLGDRLIIGLNNDDSARLLEKGSGRPINTEMARATVLAALQMVDAVILFEESTPLNLIKSLNPNVLVKGGDYDVADIVGASEVSEAGGEVKIIPFVEGYSTTSIEQRILKAGLDQ